MLAANYTNVRNHLKSYCDKAYDEDETIIVTRKAGRDVVLLSLDRYNEMEKAIQNAKYMEKLDEAFGQLDAGKGQEHALIEE